MTSRFRSTVAGTRGLTYIELLATVTLVLILATAALPLFAKLDHWFDKRLRERQLRLALATMRDAIDLYHDYYLQGLIPLAQEDVDQRGFPLSLEDLVEGVEVGALGSPDQRTVVFLYRIPVDPFTGDTDWGMRSYQDDWDSTSWGGENVYDVYSRYNGVALDGTYYTDW